MSSAFQTYCNNIRNNTFFIVFYTKRDAWTQCSNAQSITLTFCCNEPSLTVATTRREWVARIDEYAPQWYTRDEISLQCAIRVTSVDDMLISRKRVNETYIRETLSVKQVSAKCTENKKVSILPAFVTWFQTRDGRRMPEEFRRNVLSQLSGA